MTSSTTTSRRAVLFGGTAAVAAATTGLRPVFAQEMTQITTAFGWISNVEYAGFWTALEKEFFAEEGIDAGYLSGGPNAPQTLVSLAADTAQVAGANWLPILDAREQGNDFVIIGATWDRSPAALMSMAAKPVLKPEDLVGAKILAQKPEDSVIIDAILSGAGLPLEYEILPTGFSPEPLIAGDGDVYFAFATNQPITLEQMGMVEGEDFHVALLDDLGYRVKQGLLVSKRSFIDANRDATVGYLRAFVRGWQFALENPEYPVDIVLSNYGTDLGLDRAQQERQMELQSPLVTPQDPNGKLLMFDPSIIEGAMKVAAEAAGRNVPPLDELVDLSMLEEAHASL